MRVLAFLLACVAFASYGHRLKIANERVQDGSDAEQSTNTTSGSQSLAEFNPASAFGSRQLAVRMHRQPVYNNILLMSKGSDEAIPSVSGEGDELISSDADLGNELIPTGTYPSASDELIEAFESMWSLNWEAFDSLSHAIPQILWSEDNATYLTDFAPGVALLLLAEAVVKAGNSSGTNNASGNADFMDNDDSNVTAPLSATIKGFYPFPGKPSKRGFLGWLFKDAHQAVVVRSGSDKLLVDFMTAGGATHPVWWDENVRRDVWLGGAIEGEVRLRNFGKLSPPGSKMGRLREWLLAYDTENDLSLYTSNCRVFACRVVREVERLNAEDDEDAGSLRANAAELMADVRLAFGLFRAGLLPAVYPLAVLAFCWDALSPSQLGE